MFGPHPQLSPCWRLLRRSCAGAPSLESHWLFVPQTSPNPTEDPSSGSWVLWSWLPGSPLPNSQPPTSSNPQTHLHAGGHAHSEVHIYPGTACLGCRKALSRSPREHPRNKGSQTQLHLEGPGALGSAPQARRPEQQFLPPQAKKGNPESAPPRPGLVSCLPCGHMPHRWVPGPMLHARSWILISVI